MPASAPFYHAALLALRFADARAGSSRRFGPDAEALWRSFAGDLKTADRIDLLLRDADAQWPGSVGARTAFDLRAVAEDDPFGPDWSTLDPVYAEELWRSVAAASPPASVDAALDALAQAWSLSLTPFDPGPIAASDKLLVAGPSAVAACIRAFSRGSDLAWPDQVVCVATPPAHRHLAALAGLLLNATKPVTVVAPDHPDAVSLRGSRRALVSNDAHPDDLAFSRPRSDPPAGSC